MWTVSSLATYLLPSKFLKMFWKSCCSHLCTLKICQIWQLPSWHCVRAGYGSGTKWIESFGSGSGQNHSVSITLIPNPYLTSSESSAFLRYLNRIHNTVEHGLINYTETIAFVGFSGMGTNQDPRSGRNFPDPQHRYLRLYLMRNHRCFQCRAL